MSKVYSNWYYHSRYVWSGMPKLPSITSLLFLCNTLRKKWVIKLIFCMQISMKVSYKSIAWFLMVMVKHSHGSQNSKFAMSLQCLKKEMRYEVDFLHEGKSLWQSKFSSRWYYRYWWVWSTILKAHQVTSLQYLKKEVRDGVPFCMQINLKVSTIWNYYFWRKWPNMSKVPKIGSC